jgi:hypothetical protein
MLPEMENKRKALLMGGGLLILLLLVFRFGFLKTIEAYREYQNNQAQLSKLSTVQSESQQYLIKTKNLQNKYGKVYAGSMSQSELFGLINQTTDKYNGTIKHFSKVDHQKFDSYDMNTYSIELENNFKTIVSILYGLEVETSVGKVASVKMEYLDDREGKRVESDIYLKRVNFYEE